ncbi:DsbA family protein [Azospirillum sp.]|uniref:DsbA family protein n=1 Tax=Azospirillum sp. TaxID=34012 RepID=UPI002D5A02FB|nr:DsbA family protein [Azospirillum sp.]HYD67752.1 DsbA family protein [Azospirillum sp.]
MRRYVEAFAALLVLAVVAATGSVPAAAQATNNTIDTQAALADRVLGKADAPVTIIDYSSMTCPHCATFHTETLPKLKEAYLDTGKAKLIFRDFPFDQWALKASMMARCAPAERYYPLLDVLFKNQGQWSRAKDPAAALTTYGKLAGLSEATIKACWENKDLETGVLGFYMDGQAKYKVESTPTFILNDGAARITGAQPFEKFAEAIDKLSKK